MKQTRLVLALALLPATLFWEHMASAQALPTASQSLQLSAFGGVSGVFTGFKGGKNLSITAGGDLGLPVWHGLRPAIEVRGTYPLDRGLTVGQKDVLAGLKVNFLLGHRIHPYGDFLFGRGEMDYRLGVIFDGWIYGVTTTNIYSGGGGFDYDLTDKLSFKLDGQFQHWGGPTPTASGHVYSTVGTAGIVYRFNLNRRGIH